MIRFLVGFILGIYVSLYGVNAVIQKFHDSEKDNTEKIEETHEESTSDTDISV